MASCFVFRERATLTKGNRRLEKKLKEAALNVEEERRNTDQYKDQVNIFQLFQRVSFQSCARESIIDSKFFERLVPILWPSSSNL